jgi:hypothetical protein
VVAKQPDSTRWMTALSLTSIDPDGEYMLRESGDEDSAWKLVQTRAHGERWFDKLPSDAPGEPEKTVWLPEVVLVRFTDGTERYFNPNDPVEVGWV